MQGWGSGRDVCGAGSPRTPELVASQPRAAAAETVKASKNVIRGASDMRQANYGQVPQRPSAGCTNLGRDAGFVSGNPTLAERLEKNASTNSSAAVV